MSFCSPRLTEVTPDNLETLHPAASMSAHTDETGAIRLMAPKGFISRQLDSLRSFLFPSKTAHDDYQQVIAQVKQMILTAHGDKAATAFEKKFSSAISGTLPPPSLKILNARIFFSNANRIPFLNNFKKRILPELRTKYPNQIEVSDNRLNHLLNIFLDRHPEASDAQKTAFLTRKILVPANSNTHNPQPAPMATRPDSTSQEDAKLLRELGNNPKTKNAYNSTYLVLNHTALSREIADVRNDPHKFFTLLEKLSNTKEELLSNNKQPISREARTLLLKSLLANATIFEKKNPDVYSLVRNFGDFLAVQKNEPATTEQKIAYDKTKFLFFKKEIRTFLFKDEASAKEIKAFTSKLKQRTEDYQAYEKNQRALGLPVKPREAAPKAEFQAHLLSPDARDLLNAIDTQCQHFLESLE